MATAAILDFFANIKVKVNVDNWAPLPVLKSIAKLTVDANWCFCQVCNDHSNFLPYPTPL